MPDASATTGLFGLSSLQRPSDFKVAAENATDQCQKLIDDIIDTKTPPLEKVQKLDLISDVICRVVDGAELCRHVHADPKWRAAAEEVFGELSHLIFRLNAHKGLFEAVAPLCRDEAMVAELDAESRRVAELLTAEFETEGGIHLPEEERQAVIRLHSEIGQLSTLFMRQTLRDKPTFVVSPKSALQRLPRSYDRLFPEQPAHLAADEIELVAHPALCAGIQQHVPESHIRRAAYIASTSGDAGNVPVLHALAQQRHQLARTLGHESFASMTVRQCMAGSQERVLAFLHDLSGRIRPRAHEEKQLLLRRKRELDTAAGRSGGASEVGEGGALNAWDVEWLQQGVRAEAGAAAARAALRAAGLDDSGYRRADQREYLNLKNAIAGLRLVAKETLGVDMVEVAMSDGEGWGSAPGDVRKFVVMHETEGKMGTVYLDLYARPGKTKGAAQYVIVCGRRVHAFERAVAGPEEAGRGRAVSASAPSAAASAEARGVEAAAATAASEASPDYQLPVVALVMAYPRPVGVDKGDIHVPLSLGQLETIFHEFGHALHTLLSRTTYQHVSGTRTALDFVELPSHLFERFATHPSVLRRFALSSVTGLPMPAEAVAALLAERNSSAALDMQLQISHALFDQAIFSDRPMAVACSAIDEASGRLILPDTPEAAAATLPPALKGASLAAASDDASFSVPAAVDIGMTPASLNSSVVLREILRRHSSTPHVPGTSWQGSFVHVVNYGAGYYAYLFARANAAAIWESLFAADPLSRDAGERYRRELLARGGAEHPAVSVRTVLDGRDAGLDPLLRSMGLLGASSARV